MPKLFKKHFSLILFVVLIVLAAFLRLYRLDSVPPGVNRDEASIGFTAYSLLKTGKDEYGRLLPLSLQSFGDWKLPLYIYLTVPLVKIFGMTEIAVRLTSAIAGILTVGLTFFLVRLLFGSSVLAFLAMAVTTIAPWDIHLSRVESESHVAVFLTALGTYLFFKAGTKRSWLYLVSFILWALTYFTYAGNHIFTTLLVFGIIMLFRKTIFSDKLAKLGLGIFLFLAAIIFSQTLLGADTTKISGLSFFSSPFITYKNIELKRVEHNNPGSISAAFFHNRLIYAVEMIIQNYEKSFSPEFLAIHGGTNHAHNIPDFGNMYLIEYPLFFLGFAFLLTKLKDPKMKLILWWLITSPVAASITNDAPHTNRMAAILSIIPVTVALGIYWLLDQFKHKKIVLYSLSALLVIGYAVNFGIYMDRYYVHFPKNEAQYWGIWYKELTKVLASDQYKDDQVIVSHPEQSPYVFILFYSGFDPATYQKESVLYPPTPDGFYNVKSFSRYEFRPINWTEDVGRRKTVMVEKYDEIPDNLKETVTKVGGFGIYRAE